MKLEPIFDQVLSGDPVGAAYRLEQTLGPHAPGRDFYEAGSQALARRDELGEEALRFARLVFATAVERDPALGEAQHDLATTMRELGMAQDAIPHYLKALELMPGDLDSIVGLGAAQCDAGRIDEGVATLRVACDTHPDSGHAYANLGVALEKGARNEEACSAYAKAIVRFDAIMIDAKDEDAAGDAAARRRWSRIQLAQILERLGRWPQAVVEFRRLYEEEQALAEMEAEAELDGDDADAREAAGAGDDSTDEYDDDSDAGRLGLERLFTQLVKLARYDLAYLVLDDLGGELADSRTRATYAIYDAGDGFPQILMETWDDGVRQRFDPKAG